MLQIDGAALQRHWDVAMHQNKCKTNSVRRIFGNRKSIIHVSFKSNKRAGFFFFHFLSNFKKELIFN